jgi:hypothetical protein
MSAAEIPSAAALAERIIGPARYKFDELVEGIASEQRRLTAGPYLVCLWQRVVDYDGPTEWLFLGNSSHDLTEATAQADDWIDGLRAEQCAKPAFRESWHEDPAQAPCLPAMSPTAGLQVHAERSLALVSAPYAGMYICTRVLGPFPAAIIGHELFDALAGSIHELPFYFRAVGEAHRKGRTHPRPLIL